MKESPGKPSALFKATVAGFRGKVAQKIGHLAFQADKKTVRSHSCTFTGFFRCKPLRILDVLRLSFHWNQTIGSLQKKNDLYLHQPTQPSSQPFFSSTKNDSLVFYNMFFNLHRKKNTKSWFLTLRFSFSSNFRPQNSSSQRYWHPNPYSPPEQRPEPRFHLRKTEDDGLANFKKSSDIPSCWLQANILRTSTSSLYISFMDHSSNCVSKHLTWIHQNFLG